MTPIETALIILIVIWSIIFIIFGAALFIILAGVKKALDRINDILDDAHRISSGIGSPLKVASSLIGLLGKKKSSK